MARIRFKVFRSSWTSWKQLFEEAAEFAGRLSTEKFISISHSSDNNNGVVTVWYRE